MPIKPAGFIAVLRKERHRFSMARTSNSATCASREIAAWRAASSVISHSPLGASFGNTCPREESNLQHPPSEDGASARLGYADIDAEFPGPRPLPREPSRFPWSPTLEPGFSVAFTPCAKGLRTLDVATCFTANVLPTARARGLCFVSGNAFRGDELTDPEVSAPATGTEVPAALWTLSDSNRPPPPCKSGALPNELRAQSPRPLQNLASPQGANLPSRPAAVGSTGG